MDLSSLLCKSEVIDDLECQADAENTELIHDVDSIKSAIDSMFFTNQTREEPKVILKERVRCNNREKEGGIFEAKLLAKVKAIDLGSHGATRSFCPAMDKYECQQICEEDEKTDTCSSSASSEVFAAMKPKVKVYAGSFDLRNKLNLSNLSFRPSNIKTIKLGSLRARINRTFCTPKARIPFPSPGRSPKINFGSAPRKMNFRKKSKDIRRKKYSLDISAKKIKHGYKFDDQKWVKRFVKGITGSKKKPKRSSFVEQNRKVQNFIYKIKQKSSCNVLPKYRTRRSTATSHRRDKDCKLDRIFKRLDRIKQTIDRKISVKLIN